MQPALSQELVRTGSVDLTEETVQEVAFLPGTPANPAGWGVVGRTLSSGSAFQGVTFVDLSDATGCSMVLGENVQDVTWGAGYLYATMKEAGSGDEGVAVLDAGDDPCGATPDIVQTLGMPLRNATNLLFVDAGLAGVDLLAVANSFPAQGCDAGYQREDLSVFIYDLTPLPGPPTLFSQWTPGEDGSGFARSCDRCASQICGPNDIALSPGGPPFLAAVASLLDGLWVVSYDNINNPVAAAHLQYTYTGRDANGTPIPDRINVTGDVEFTPDGEYLVTTDFSSQGGHVLVWRVSDILAACSDPGNPCEGTDVEPVGEFFPPGTPPGFAHKLLADWPYLWVTWFDYGLVLLDMTDPTDPLEVTKFNPLAAPPAGSFNQWGAYGAALASTCDPGSPSDLLLSDIGIYSSSADAAGSLSALRWGGEPTVTGPLRVSRVAVDPSSFVFDWSRPPLTGFGRIYSGAIDPGTPGPLDNHDVPDAGWCVLDCCSATLPDPDPQEPLEYFLLRGRDGCGRLGSLTDGSEGPRLDPEPTICP